MIPFAIAVFSVGVADLIAGSSGRPSGFFRCAAAWILGVGAGVASADSLDFDTEGTLILGTIVAIFLPLWFSIRATDRLSVRRGAFGFWAVLLFFAGLIATESQWRIPDGGGRLADWIADVRIAGFDRDFERVFVCAALIMFLLATANGVVRLVLAMSSEDSRSELASADGETRLRGGRMIGPIERLLIFGFAVAGQMAAAVLVVSAKALLRFPEVSQESKVGRPEEIHRLNEYLVVGSLSSWALAFLAAALMRGVDSS